MKVPSVHRSGHVNDYRSDEDDRGDRDECRIGELFSGSSSLGRRRVKPCGWSAEEFFSLQNELSRRRVSACWLTALAAFGERDLAPDRSHLTVLVPPW